MTQLSKDIMNTHQATYNTKPVQLRLKPELHQWVHQEGQRQDRSANWIINKLLEEARDRAQQQAQGVAQ